MSELADTEVEPAAEALIAELDAGSWGSPLRAAWTFDLGRKLALLAITDLDLILATHGRVESWKLRQLRNVRLVGGDLRINLYGEPSVTLRARPTGSRTAQAAGRILAGISMARPRPAERPTSSLAFFPVSAEMVVTLPSMPGCDVIRVHGVVTALGSNSGWTASAKGANALHKAMEDLRLQAGQMGANAILGLTTSAFGANGGITDIVGGDAVGVLLSGTAVTVRPHQNERAPSPDPSG